MTRFITAVSTIMTANSYLRSILTPLACVTHRQGICTILIGLIAFGGSATVGLITGIPEPRVNDEFSYLLAAETFAQGRLTNPTHPLWVYLETFYVIQQPTYMSKYPPAQALFLAAGQVIWGHPIWGVWMSFGLMCAAISWMLYAWVPPHWAILGGLLAVINPYLGITGYWSQSYWGGAVAAMGGALVIGGLRRTARSPNVANSLVLGLGLAILANSRPYEGLVFSLPAAAMLSIWILRKRGPEFWAYMARSVAPLVIVIALTALAMGFYNLRITGSPFHMPYQMYSETYEVAPKFVWQNLRPEPSFNHKVMRDLSYGVDLELFKMQRTVVGFLTKNLVLLPWWLIYSLNIFMIALIATLSLTVRWALQDRWGRFTLLTYAVFACGLFLEVPLMLHYWAPITSINYLYLVQGMRLWESHGSNTGGRQTLLRLVPLIAALSLLFSLMNRLQPQDPTSWYRQRAAILNQLAEAKERHLVIVKYGPTHLYTQEWVHNGPDIDAASVVWARDIDGQNCDLVDYFKDRRMWLLEVDWHPSGPKLQPYLVELCQ